MVHQLKAYSVSSEDLDWAPSMQFRQLAASCNSNSRKADVPFQPPWISCTLVASTHTDVKINVFKLIFKNDNKKVYLQTQVNMSVYCAANHLSQLIRHRRLLY